MVDVPYGEVLLWCSALAVLLYTFTAHPAVAKGIPKAFLDHVLGLQAATPATAPVFDAAWVARQAAHTLRTAARAFGSGYLLRLGLALVGMLVGGRVSLPRLLAVVYSAEHVRTGAFFGSMALLHWAVRHALHYARRTDDAWNHAAAGFAAGLPFAGVRSPSIALYFSTKAAEVRCRAAVPALTLAVPVLDRRGQQQGPARCARRRVALRRVGGGAVQLPAQRPGRHPASLPPLRQRCQQQCVPCRTPSP